MTLCELATAKHHSMPLECAPFAFDAASSRYPSRLLQAECVEFVGSQLYAHIFAGHQVFQRFITECAVLVKLFRIPSRSPCVDPFFPSRNPIPDPVPAQLCFAFRRWNDIGTFLRLSPIIDHSDGYILRHSTRHLPERNVGEDGVSPLPDRS